MTEEKKTNTPETEEVAESRNFILNFIDEDIAEGGQFQGMTVHTRFPPEPNGYLHIGHCKALTIDFGTAERYNGLCNLRMDDTNPTKEDEEFVEAIKQDIHWLGFDWGDRFFYGSDYFEEDYRQAVLLIKKGLAYVCQLTPEEYETVRHHPIDSYNLLKKRFPIEVAEIARSHHERLDGSGYPNHLTGDKMPPEVRIISVADTFDAMTSDRPYKKGKPTRQAMDELYTLTNQYDRSVLDVLRCMVEDGTADAVCRMSEEELDMSDIT